MKFKGIKAITGILFLVTLMMLTACASNNEEKNQNDQNQSMDVEKDNHGHMDMDHSGSGELPPGLKKAESPKFEVGSKAMIKAKHMAGMDGAEATIVGAYDTTAYVVSYTPTTGGERVENHKWVIQEEIAGAGNETLAPGKKVTLNASHMKGMDGATAEIVSAEKTTVYMVDYTPTTGGERVTNHKWVTESELAAE